MRGQLYVLRSGLIEMPVEIPEGTGSIKVGRDPLVIELVSEHKLPWYEFEPVFVTAENVEVMAKVRSYKEIESGQGSNIYQVTAQKVSIKENPILSLAFDKDKNETKVHDPDDLPAKKLSEIQSDLKGVAATSTEEKKLLSPGEEMFPEDMKGEPADVTLYRNLDQFIRILRAEDENPMATGLIKLALSLKNHLNKEVTARTRIERDNTQQSESLIALHLKIDKMEAELQELIENYIPDLSAELSDES